MDRSPDHTWITRESVRCVSCGAEDSRIRYHLPARDFRHNKLWLNGQPVEMDSTETLVICNRCGLAFINPRVSSLPGLAPYTEEEELAYFEATRSSRMRAYRSLVGRLPGWLGRPPESLLDIGCGDGVLLEAAQQGGIAKVFGLEISGPLVRLVRDRLGDDTAGSSDTTEIPGGSYEVVALINVLEHLPDPAAMLREAHRILKPGGILLIHVPNFGGLPARLMGERWSQIEPYAHFYYFTEATLRALLIQSGLIPIQRFHLKVSRGIRGIVQDGSARLGLYLDNGLGIASRRESEGS